MPDTVHVTLEVEPEIAAALEDPATRARVERLIRRMVRPAGIERCSRRWMPYRRLADAA